jgi:transcriptional regulator of acetoin/glycerol metabolism
VTEADLFPDARHPRSAPVLSVPAEPQMTLAEVRDAAERAHIAQTLQATDGAMQDAASRLGVSRTTLWEKMRRLGISAG